MTRPILIGLFAVALSAAPILAAEPDVAPSPPTAVQPDEPQDAAPDGVMLRVDVVRLARGYRVSQIVGKPVYNDAGEKIGTIDDLIVRPDDKVMFGVVSVGGFLGIGDRLVAVPYPAFTSGTDGKLVLAGITKDDLKAAPAFKYADEKKRPASSERQSHP
jgi:hypothetical protein